MNLPGLYHPGSSVLHRMGAGPKLLGLLLLGILTGLAPAMGPAQVWPAPPWLGAQLWVSLFVLLAGVLVWTLARLPVVMLRPVAVGAGVLVVALAAVQWWVNGWPAALGMTARLVGLLLAAWAVTATTRVSELLQVVTDALAPLRRFGVPVERIGLAVALTIRAIPMIADGLHRAREARSARGAPAGLRGLPGLTVNTVVHTIRLADAMGEALIARGGLDRAAPDSGRSTVG